MLLTPPLFESTSGKRKRGQVIEVLLSTIFRTSDRKAMAPTRRVSATPCAAAQPKSLRPQGRLSLRKPSDDSSDEPLADDASKVKLMCLLEQLGDPLPP